jgi:hypothetical protein
VKAGAALTLVASRFDLAIWTCEPSDEDERKVKDCAPMEYVNQAIAPSCREI